MKRVMTRVTLLLALCMVFSLGLFRENVFAASAVKSDKIAYIDSNNNLILRFEAFSKTGYKFTVEGSNDKSLSGSLKAGSTEAKININDIYASNTRYTLRLTADDSGNYLDAVYYTGTKLNAAAVTVKDRTITSSGWKAPSESAYTGSQLKVASKSGALSVMASGKAARDASKVTATGQNVAGEYTAYTIFMYGDACGYGVSKTINYVPAVSSLNVSPNTKRATVSWLAVRGAAQYRIAYKLSSASGYSHVTVKKDTKYVITGLQSGKAYNFKVQAYYNGKWGDYCAEKTSKIPVVPGKVKGVGFTVNAKAQLCVKWDYLKNATSYEVYARKKGESSYTKLVETPRNMYNINRLSKKSTYSIIVYAKQNGYLSDVHSKAVSVKPAAFIKKNSQRILAGRVRGMYYKGRVCIYTTKKYTKEIKEAYVNYNHITSKTNYLIYAFLYTQEAAIFKRSGGKWKMIRSFTIASGSDDDHTPTGKFEIFKKEYAWKHAKTSTLWVSHFYKKASFHSRPHYNKGGGIQDKRIGKPVSNGCIRCPDQDAIFIYKKIPMGTRVRVR